MTTAGTATEPLSWQREDTLGNHERLTAAALGGFAAASDLAACVVPLLSALGWRGNPRHVAEALPHFATTLDLTGLRNVMSNLGFTSRPERTALGDIDPRLMPCLYLPDGAGAMVLLESNEDGITVFNGETGTVDLLPWPRSRGVAYFFTLADDDLDERPALLDAPGSAPRCCGSALWCCRASGSASCLPCCRSRCRCS